jgi:hypothetical protein
VGRTEIAYVLVYAAVRRGVKTTDERDRALSREGDPLVDVAQGEGDAAADGEIERGVEAVGVADESAPVGVAAVEGEAWLVLGDQEVFVQGGRLR